MKTPTAYRILLADDDEDDRLFFKEAISDLNLKYDLTIVNDGVQLLDYLKQKDAVMPDLLFLDINMPKKNGMKALQEIRSNDKLKDICVAMYSTSSSPTEIEDAMQKGANLYIAKPNDIDHLKKIIAKSVSMNWQYQKSGLNKENFVLKI